MAEQHAVRMQRPFRRTGRARCVDHQRRVVGRGGDRREFGGGARQHRVEVLGPVRRSVDRPHNFERERSIANGRELGEPLRIADQCPCTGILQAIRNRLGSEEHRQRQRDGAELVDGDVAHRDGGALRQQQRDAITPLNAVGSERIGEPIRGFAQRAITHLLDLSAAAHIENSGPRRIALRPAVADVDPDVIARRDLPAERAIERAVVARGRKDRGCVHGGAG